jgi:hypothetical protein
LTLRKIKREGKVNVAFVVSSLPMWRLQTLYDRLICDKRFKVSIVLVPFDTFSNEQQSLSISELKDYFDSREVTYIDLRSDANNYDEWTKLNPQLVFYQQMYSTIYHGALSVEKNLRRLICYLPYGAMTLKGDWLYNTKFTNLAWRLYYPSDFHAEYARNHSYNHGTNVKIVGEANAISFKRKDASLCNVEDSYLYRIIWAPHYSVNGGYMNRSSFLWMADFMLLLAKRYSDRVKFIIKPHPRLISTLYMTPGWGKQRTDAYFRQWEEGDNLQLSTGNYVDLFNESDAMIHDSGSFTLEYLFTGNPVLFVAKDFEQVYDGLNQYGSSCLDLHYHGSSEDDIIHFIEDVVLSGRDPLKEARDHFYDNVLCVNGTSGVGDAIYQDLVDCF